MILSASMGPLIRYTLLQVPGWLLLGCLLWWAIQADWIVFSTAAWIMGLWLIKDAMLYPICKRAFEKGPKSEIEKLIGREAVTIKTLAPEGLVELDGELWSAQALDNAPIAAGTRIRITGAEGLTLIVEPVA